MRVQSIEGVSGFGGSSKLLGHTRTPPVDVPAPAALGLLLLSLGLMRGHVGRRRFD